jgi:type II secretory pathway pseudopilin PulG
MMAAVALMALLAALVGPRVAALTSRDLRREAEELGRLMELGRQRSVVMGIPHRVLLDLDDVSYTLEWAPQAEPEAAPEPPPDARGVPRQEEPLDLSAPYENDRAYSPIVGMLGDTVLLSDDVVIAGVETAEGYLEKGQVEVTFETDGTASAAKIYLENEVDRSLMLEVLPLADRVRIRDAD